MRGVQDHVLLRWLERKYEGRWCVSHGVTDVKNGRGQDICLWYGRVHTRSSADGERPTVFVVLSRCFFACPGKYPQEIAWPRYRVFVFLVLILNCLMSCPSPLSLRLE